MVHRNLRNSRFAQYFTTASLAVLLATSPIHNPLAEEIQKKPVAAEQAPIKKQEQGTLKLSTNSCKTGESVFVDVVNSKGEQMRGETVKVISPTGKEYEVLISNELNGFTFDDIHLDSVGVYKFVYKDQVQLVCVSPSERFRKLNTLDDFAHMPLKEVSEFFADSEKHYGKTEDSSSSFIFKDVKHMLYFWFKLSIPESNPVLLNFIKCWTISSCKEIIGNLGVQNPQVSIMLFDAPVLAPWYENGLFYLTTNDSKKVFFLDINLAGRLPASRRDEESIRIGAKLQELKDGTKVLILGVLSTVKDRSIFSRIAIDAATFEELDKKYFYVMDESMCQRPTKNPVQ